MSFDIAPKGRGVFYLNFRQVGDRTQTVTCEVKQRFDNANLIDSTGNYIVALERLIVPLHNIPFLQAEAACIQFIAKPGQGGAGFNFNNVNTYSLKELFEQFNEQAAANAAVGANSAFKINSRGAFQFYFANFAQYDVQFSAQLQSVLDVSNIPYANGVAGQYDPNGGPLILGNTSLVDRFDQLHKIQVEVNGLSIQQEIIDTNTAYEILTDFSIPHSYNFSYTEPDLNTARSNNELSVSFPVRENLVYTAESARRYAVLTGFSPVQNVKLACVAIYKDGTRNDIILPPNSVFECKLGFYRRV